MKPIRNSAKAVIIEDRKLLTLKCFVDGTLFYQLPGGGQEVGETLVKALKRECIEEISSKVEVGDLITIREYIGGKHGPDNHQVEFMFSCQLADPTQCAPGAEPDRVQIGIEWLPLDQLDQYNLLPKALIPILMASSLQDAPTYLGDVN